MYIALIVFVLKDDAQAKILQHYIVKMNLTAIERATRGKKEAIYVLESGDFKGIKKQKIRMGFR